MDEKPNRRLILVSNRLPFQLLEKNSKITLKQSDGGLVSALKSYFDNQTTDQSFDQKRWIGSADFPEKRWHKYSSAQPEQQQFAIEPIFIEPKIYNKYYNGFCNATLWPLFHYFPSYTLFDDEAFQYYEQANQLFADRIIELVQPNDTIWIHDYQLFLVPAMVRAKRPDVTIGFFLHIPFPSYEIFRLLHRPWKEKIIAGLLSADLVGFHTYEYVQHFLKTVSMVMGLDNQYRTIRYKNRMVKTDLFPLGIDYEKFKAATNNGNTITIKNEILKNFSDKKIIFSVDRLDYTKGINHRLAGFETFLKNHPEWHQKVVFVLVVVPSREIISKYNERKQLIEELVGRLNGEYSTLSWQPIIYRYASLGFDELCAMYQAADVGLITPLRDGMNLVAKEYVASRVAQRGVLILSELAGAASELGEAMLVNPWDKNEMAVAIEQALTMPVADQQKQMSVMQKRLTDYDVQRWVDDFLNKLSEVKVQQQVAVSNELSGVQLVTLLEKYKIATNRLLLIDYDGTLVPFARHPAQAVPSETVLTLLEELSKDPHTNVTIISGRDRTILTEWFGHLPVNLIAEHGAAMRLTGKDWEIEKHLDQQWKANIRPTLEIFERRSPGSFIEEKSHTLAWHYRNTDKDLGFIRSRELLDNLMHLVRGGDLQVIDGNKVIEVRIAGVDKGHAAKKMVQHIEPDFVLAIGDDKTDEDMFQALHEYAYTIKVGQGITAAHYTVTAQPDVLSLFKNLTQ